MIDIIRQFYIRHRSDVWIAGVVLLVALIPRMFDLGIFLTADEKNWIDRSHAFLEAFLEGRFNDMLQTTHPGVTVLWVVGIAILLQQQLSGIPYDGSLLVHFVKIAQVPIAFLNALWVPGLYVMLRVVIEKVAGGWRWQWRYGWPALAALMVALDPFVIGYSRVAHVDVLLAGFVVLAALAIVMYGITGWSRRWLWGSSVLTGLALLTKVPAVFLLPWWGLVVLVWGGGMIKSVSWWRERGFDLLRWLGVIVLLIIVLWPAVLFVPDPRGNALLVKRDVAIAASTPHNMTEDYTLEADHYAATLLTRTTPVTLVFGVVAVSVLLLVSWRYRSNDSVKIVKLSWLAVAYVLFFVIMMTLGAKKGDRYILPVWPMLDVIAAAGLVVAGGWVRGSWGKRWGFGLAGGATVVYLTLVVARYHPYALAYHNPWFPSDLSQSLGWGEGLNLAAEWIDEHDSGASVASWYPEELAAFTKARVIHISGHERPRVRYVVLYRNMLGRDPDHPATALVEEYLRQREPVHVVRIAGKEYVWIFEKPAYERVVNEIVPGRKVGQALPVNHVGAQALDVLVATYKGEAAEGQLVVRLLEKSGGRQLASWQQDVADLGDNEWLTLGLPEGVRVEAGQQYYVEVSTRGVTGERAPTVLYTRDYADPAIRMVIDGEEREGNLGLRWRYRVGDALVTDQDVKLFSD